MLIFITSHFHFVMLQSIYLHLAVKIFFSSFSVTSSYLLIKISTCANEHIIKIDKISVIIFFLKIYCILRDNSEPDTNCFQSREHFPFVLWVLIDLLAVFCCEEAEVACLPPSAPRTTGCTEAWKGVEVLWRSCYSQPWLLDPVWGTYLSFLNIWYLETLSQFQYLSILKWHVYT